MEGVKFSSYIREKEGSSKIIGANCVTTVRRKKNILEEVSNQINERSLPLELQDVPKTNLFKLKLKE